MNLNDPVEVGGRGDSRRPATFGQKVTNIIAWGIAIGMGLVFITGIIWLLAWMWSGIRTLL